MSESKLSRRLDDLVGDPPTLLVLSGRKLEGLCKQEKVLQEEPCLQEAIPLKGMYHILI